MPRFSPKDEALAYGIGIPRSARSVRTSDARPDTKEMVMNAAEFEAALTAAGFTTVATGELPANRHVDAHSHPFDVRARVVTGAITLTIEGIATTYRAGEIFEVPAGTPHAEDVGRDGVTYLVGKRAPAS
jgi:quercetin dioxygenase-like cupin family protein